MAGGNAQDVSSAFPKGENGLVLIQSSPVNVQASKTDHIWCEFTAPFAFRIIKAEAISAIVTIANAVTINVEDDTGTPKVPIVNSAGITAGADGTGDRGALTVDDSVLINAGALVNFSYISGAGDSSTGTVIWLWVKPEY
jgi:hypothetical protein